MAQSNLFVMPEASLKDLSSKINAMCSLYTDTLGDTHTPRGC